MSVLGRVLAALPTQARPWPLGACSSAPVRKQLTPLCSHQGRSPFSPSEAAVLEQALGLSPQDVATLLGGAGDAFRAAAASGTNAQVRMLLRLHHGSSCV